MRKALMLAAYLIGATTTPLHAAGKERAPIPQAPGRWLTVDDYPEEALRQEYSGTIDVGLTVGPDGKVKNCTVIWSSGQTVLDEATCNLMTQRATFEPALDQSGRPAEGHYRHRVSWKLSQVSKEETAQLIRQFMFSSVTQLTFVATADGQAKACVMEIMPARGDIVTNPCPNGAMTIAQRITERLPATGSGERAVRWIFASKSNETDLSRALSRTTGWQRLAMQTAAFVVDAQGLPGDCVAGLAEGSWPNLPPICGRMPDGRLPPLQDAKGKAVAQKFFMGHVVFIKPVP